MASTHEQDAFDTNSSGPQTNLIAGIGVGNLLIGAVAHRTDGTSYTTSEIINDSGAQVWDNAAVDSFPVGDENNSTYRRGLGLHYRIATADDLDVQAGQWNGGTDAHMFTAEISDYGDGTFLGSGVDSNGATADANTDSIDTGSYSGTVLLVGIFAAKKAGGDPDGLAITWGDDLATPDRQASDEFATNDVAMGYAWKEVSASGVLTVSYDISGSTDDQNNGLMIGYMAFQVSGGGGGSIAPQAHHLRMLQSQY